MQKSAIDWVVTRPSTAYVQKYIRGNFIVFKCSGHIHCQSQIKITKDDVAEKRKGAFSLVVTPPQRYQYLS